jgi:hypothetical protein
MHTAAAASDARIPGLESEEAARLRDRLAELGEAKASVDSKRLQFANFAISAAVSPHAAGN